MDLREWLNQQSPSASLHAKSVREAAQIIWEKPLHRYYTDHSVLHSERVIEILNRLAQQAMTSGPDTCLSTTEVLILLAAAYLHDIGMQDERSGDGDLEVIRNKHHEVTAEIIRGDSFQSGVQHLSLGLEGIDVDVVSTIALVAEAHRKTDLSGCAYDEFGYGNERIRPRLLAALLRLADELDIDFRRVHLELLVLMDVPVVSCYHWFLCYYVSAVSIENGLIGVEYRFPEGHLEYANFVVPLVHTAARERLEQVAEMLWEQYGIRLRASTGRKIRPVPGLALMPPKVERHAREMAGRIFPQRYATYEQNVVPNDGEPSSFPSSVERPDPYSSNG